MNWLGLWIRANTEWLYTKLLETKLVFLDLWSFVHALSGFTLFSLLLWGRVKHPRSWLLGVLVGYELLELAFIYAAFHAFHPETLKDQVTDIVVGMIGGALAGWVASSPRTRAEPRTPIGWRPLAKCESRGPMDSKMPWLPDLMASAIVAFFWVGSYGYRYNVARLNGAGISWYAWICWTLALLAASRLFRALLLFLPSPLARVLATWSGYALVLVVVEAIAYHWLEIREIGHPGATPLVADLIHGTPWMHGFYLTAPLWGIAVSCFASTVLEGAARARNASCPISFSFDRS